MNPPKRRLPMRLTLLALFGIAAWYIYAQTHHPRTPAPVPAPATQP